MTRTLDGQQLCYEVLAPGKEPVFQYLDPARTKLRIHTKLVKQTGI